MKSRFALRCAVTASAIAFVSCAYWIVELLPKPQRLMPAPKFLFNDVAVHVESGEIVYVGYASLEATGDRSKWPGWEYIIALNGKGAIKVSEAELRELTPDEIKTLQTDGDEP